MTDPVEKASCCAPSRGGAAGAPVPAPSPGGGVHGIEQVLIPAGRFERGDSHGDGRPSDGETPRHWVRLEAFSMDATTVTNNAFAAFVDATGYRTEAEVFGYSAVFHLAFDGDEADIVGRPPQVPWWLGVTGAEWRHPGGRHSSITDLGDHPVVHVTWNDAQAYCAWAGRRLPTEAEWEYASRGGIASVRYPWGDELLPEGEWRCNIWQGEFPRLNTEDDGWVTTAPVRSYQPNAWGLWQTVGNVWEWCSDWYDALYYETSPEIDPRGPVRGQARVLRGGSFLCHDSYCNRYRNSARSSNTPDSSSANSGFRTVSLRE